MSDYRISRLEVENFKSLVDFRMDLAKFTCLVGLNGSGKSTVLQFVDFLSELMRGNLSEWLMERQWSANDLCFWDESSKLIRFHVEITDTEGRHAGIWKGDFNTLLLKCEREELVFGDTKFKVFDNKFEASHTQKSYDITMDYEGSLLSKVRDPFLPEPVKRFRDFFRGSRTLELLSPRLMRQRTKGPSATIGRGGERLSAYLHDLLPEKRHAIESELKRVYPHFQKLATRELKPDVRVLEIVEDFQGKHFKTEARHLNDGLLRILAMITNSVSNAGLLVFDEIENGINPELVEFVINLLVETEQQVIVTTHSPMILNYLDDEVAKSGVIYLYKTNEGFTRSIPFFSIPSLQKKLELMGPGEAFVDTNLLELFQEIDGLIKGEK